MVQVNNNMVEVNNNMVEINNNEKINEQNKENPSVQSGRQRRGPATAL